MWTVSVYSRFSAGNSDIYHVRNFKLINQTLVRLVAFGSWSALLPKVFVIHVKSCFFQPLADDLQKSDFLGNQVI